MTVSAKILVVDDEPGIRFSMEEVLTRDGHIVTTIADGETALTLLEQETFDLVLLDLRLPGISGIELLTALKQLAPKTVAIVLTAHASLETAVEALRYGAHDYLFKPCKTVELRQSIQRGLQERVAQLRQQKLLQQLEEHLASSLQDIRDTIQNTPTSTAIPSSKSTRSAPKPDPTQNRFLQRANLIVDFDRHLITVDDNLLELSLTEFNLLAYLISEAPRVVAPQELVREVQGYESEQWEASETVRYHIYRLRQKIKAASNQANIIKTVRGVGYTIYE